MKRKDASPYGSKRSESLHLGFCNISIPDSHRQGILERPNWFIKQLFDESPKKYFTLLDNQEMDEKQFVESFKDKLANSTEQDVLLFIHGYNTKFKDALYRTAQLGYDLCFKGITTAFSWPSSGNVASYMTDRENAEYSVKFLCDYIKLILKSSNINKFHIIAHSMGNIVLCKALERLRGEGVYPNSIFNQVILAAPDIDKGTFLTQILPAIKKNPNITLYASDKDKALIISKKSKGDYVRLGEGGKNLVVSDGLDSIDASEINTDFLGHGYFASTQSLLNEIHSVLLNLTPDKRMLDCYFNAENRKYWVLRKN